VPEGLVSRRSLPSSIVWGMSERPESGPELLAVLRAHEAELRAQGIETIILFGSFARGGETATSDVDLLVRPGKGFSPGGFEHFSRLDALRERLKRLLGRDIDIVEEPVVAPRLRRIIAREGVRAF
jgi:uncharacterized protein